MVDMRRKEFCFEAGRINDRRNRARFNEIWSRPLRSGRDHVSFSVKLHAKETADTQHLRQLDMGGFENGAARRHRGTKWAEIHEIRRNGIYRRMR